MERWQELKRYGSAGPGAVVSAGGARSFASRSAAPMVSPIGTCEPTKCRAAEVAHPTFFTVYNVTDFTSTPIFHAL